MREPKPLLSLILASIIGIAILLALNTGRNAGSTGQGLAENPALQSREDSPQSGSELADLASPPEEGDGTQRAAINQVGASIRGKITSPTEEVAGLQIRLRAALSAGSNLYPFADLSSGENGGFQLQGIPQGRYRIEIYGEPVPAGVHHDWFTLTNGQSLDLGKLYIPTPGSIRGRVIDGQGLTVANQLVYHSHRPGRSTASFNRRLAAGEEGADRSTLTDAEGSFIFARLQPGNHFFLFEGTQYEDHETRAEVAEAQEVDLGNIKLRSGTEIYGRVVGPDGAPMANALVIPKGRMGGLLHRKGVRSSEDGSFHLPGMSRWGSDSIVAQSDGYVDAVQPWDSNQNSIVLQLQHSLSLLGHVEGAGEAKTTITIESSGYGDLPPSVSAMLWRPLPVRSDGSFQVDGLGAGRYEITAAAEGLGTSKEREFDLRAGMAPLVIRLQNYEKINVLVRDEHGKPIAGAQVVSNPEPIYKLGYMSSPVHRSKIYSLLRGDQQGGEKTLTNDEGLAFLRRIAGTDFGVAATKDGYLATGGSFSSKQMPSTLELELLEAASITGRLDEVSGRERYRLGVMMELLPGQATDEERSYYRQSAVVDAEGRFSISGIYPGRYEASIWRRNLTWIDNPAKRPANITPLLPSETDSRGRKIIEMVGGERGTVDLSVPPVGIIRGRVLHMGNPLPGAYVFEMTEDKGWRGLDHEDAHESRPFLRTGEDGRFEFHYVNPGTYRLYARHPDAAVPSEPVKVAISDHALALEQDIVLGAGEVRGQLDLQPLDKRQRSSLTAYLFKRENAGSDPFYHGHHGLPQTSGMKKLKIGEDGKFSFPYLPAGDWVLRIVTRLNQMLYQIPLHTERDQIIDLGIFALPPTVRITMEVEQAGEDQFKGVWINRLYDETKEPVFSRTALLGGSKLELSGITPGRYRAELMKSHGFEDMWSSGLSGERTSKFAEFEVHADGSVSPSKLVF